MNPGLKTGVIFLEHHTTCLNTGVIFCSRVAQDDVVGMTFFAKDVIPYTQTPTHPKIYNSTLQRGDLDIRHPSALAVTDDKRTKRSSE
jgi:hypothetical protein